MIGDTLGERIKFIRQRRGLTQAQLADKAGAHRHMVRRIEKGLSDPTVTMFMYLAVALGTPPEDFIRGLKTVQPQPVN